MTETIVAVAGMLMVGAMLYHEGFRMIDVVGKRTLGVVFVVAGSLMLALALINGVQQAVLNVLELKELI